MGMDGKNHHKKKEKQQQQQQQQNKTFVHVCFSSHLGGGVEGGVEFVRQHPLNLGSHLA